MRVSVILWKQNVPKAFCTCQSHSKQASLTTWQQGLDTLENELDHGLALGFLLSWLIFWPGLWRVEAMVIMTKGKWWHSNWAPASGQVLYCCHIWLESVSSGGEKLTLIVFAQWKFRSNLLPTLPCSLLQLGKPQVGRRWPRVGLVFSWSSAPTSPGVPL